MHDLNDDVPGTKDFFQMVFCGLPGTATTARWVNIRTWSGGTFGRGTGPTQSHWFAWPDHLDRIVGFCAQNQDQDIYVVPALFTTRDSATARNIGAQAVVYADADELSLESLRTDPTIVVETSPGRHHVYWVVSDTTDTAELAVLGRRIAHAHREEGCDPGGWDSGQLLRVPGTKNNKPGNNFTVRLKEISGVVYTFEDLEDFYPSPIDEVKGDVSDLGPMPSRETWPDEIDINDLMQQSPELGRLYRKSADKGDVDRSGAMYAFLSEMRRMGWEPVKALAAGWYSSINKYKQDGRPPEELWREVNKVWNDPESAPVAQAWELDDLFTKRQEEKEDPTQVVARRRDLLTFLSQEEMSKVPFDTFVDQYQEWTATITDALPQYQRAAAMTILSSVFGEYGKCPSSFDVPLTLWFMVMGPSTRSRKSTVMRIMRSFLESISDNGNYIYGIGDDATPEGLAKALDERPHGHTSLFARDELHGLLVEEASKKYMAGLQTLLTQLYDGVNRQRLRASESAGFKQPKSVNFPIYGTGVFKDTAHHLKEDDFASGHLARFLYVVGEPPEMSPETEWLDRKPKGVGKAGNLLKKAVVVDERGALVKAIEDARSHWERQIERGKTEAIHFEDCACGDDCDYHTCACEDCPWRRWNNFKYDMKLEAQQYEQAEILLNTAERLGWSAMKAACLLAMSEKRGVVSMRHLLKAIHMATEWFGYMVLVADRVKATEWKKRQDDVADKVMSKGNRGITRNELYRGFSNNLTVGEFGEVMSALELAGTVCKHKAAVGRAVNGSMVERYYWPGSCEQKHG